MFGVITPLIYYVHFGDKIKRYKANNQWHAGARKRKGCLSTTKQYGTIVTSPTGPDS